MRRLAALVLAALALSGCGLGPGEERGGSGAEIRVTRDFGRERLGVGRVDPVREDETVMRALQGQREVETRFGGKFVQAIDGLRGDEGARRDWFYFVNGFEAGVGAADFELHSGDVVQWDYRDWSATMRVPRIVGAYPEPFLNGYRGKRYPVRVECEDVDSESCRTVKDRLADDGVGVNSAAIGATSGPEVIRVVVARWEAARDLQSAETIEAGPQASGVFARFDSDSRLELLDERGRRADVPTAGVGLIAATAIEEQGTVWFVTGADDAAVTSAARAFGRDALRDAFAVAIARDGRLPLPVGDRP